MIIQHNLSAMAASRQLNINEGNRSKRARNLGSGYRINIAADDAAGLQISEKMRGQIRGLMRGSSNAQDGISLVQTADGALKEVHEMLQRINELAIQAANDTNTESDRDKIQEEINLLKEEINNIGKNTEFNTIKIFKPTNVPDIKGTPTDMLVFNEDHNGTTRVGGIIYNGIRYAYEEMNLSYDGDNIKAGTYSVEVEGQNGDKQNIKLIFDGKSRTPAGREYELMPSDAGISIDGILYAWNTMRNDNGVALDTNNITAGKYSFEHAGLTISFETEDGMDLDSLITRLEKDGLANYTLMSSNAPTKKVEINPTVDITDVTVNNTIQNYIPGNTTSNSSSYKMHADDTGLYMYIPDDQSHGQGRVELTHRTWEELGITDEDFMEVDAPNDNSGLNPGSTVTGGEASSVYTYTDSITGISINFTIDSEVSKDELISSVNNWDIDVNTNNQMVFTSNGNSDVSAGTHAQALDAYGTQYAMGRNMDSQMTLQSGSDINYSGDTLSFTMTDANGTNYNMQATNATSLAKSSIESKLNDYISRYASNYLARVKGTTSSRISSTYDVAVRFTEENNSNYWMNLECNIDFSGWISDNDFSYTTSTDKDGNVTYSITSQPSVSKFSTEISNLATDVVNKMNNTTMSVATNNTPITADNSISSTTPTENIRYSSRPQVGDREMKIHVGANENQVITIKLPALDCSILGLSGIDVTNNPNAESAISSAQAAIEQVSQMRGYFGAVQNRLEFASKVNENAAENLQASESKIRDADMAEEMVAYSKSSILSEAAQSMLVQANQSPRAILQLLS